MERSIFWGKLKKICWVSLFLSACAGVYFLGKRLICNINPVFSKAYEGKEFLPEVINLFECKSKHDAEKDPEIKKELAKKMRSSSGFLFQFVKNLPFGKKLIDSQLKAEGIKMTSDEIMDLIEENEKVVEGVEDNKEKTELVSSKTITIGSRTTPEHVRFIAEEFSFLYKIQYFKSILQLKSPTKYANSKFKKELLMVDQIFNAANNYNEKNWKDCDDLVNLNTALKNKKEGSEFMLVTILKWLGFSVNYHPKKFLYELQTQNDENFSHTSKENPKNHFLENAIVICVIPEEDNKKLYVAYFESKTEYLVERGVKTNAIMKVNSQFVVHKTFNDGNFLRDNLLSFLKNQKNREFFASEALIYVKEGDKTKPWGFMKFKNNKYVDLENNEFWLETQEKRSFEIEVYLLVSKFY